jgi:hypothetical protein
MSVGGGVSLDDVGLAIGREIIKHAIRAWLDIRRDSNRRGRDLIDLLEVAVADKFHRRDLARRLEDVGDQAARRLRPLYDAEFRDLPENERLATLNAVADALIAAELDDRTLFLADADPVKLAREVRRRVPSAAQQAGLGDAATQLYQAVLDESCMALVHIIRQLPEFPAAALSEQLSRESLIINRLGQIVARLPRITLDAPRGTDHDAEFRHRYLDAVIARHDELELFGIDEHHHRPNTKVSVAYFSLTVTSDRRPFRYGRQILDEDWFGPKHRDGPGGLRVEAALADRPRTLLRGEAGSGKTTLLQWLAVSSARGSFTGQLAPWNGRVPFLIRLRAHADQPLPRPEQFVGEAGAMLAGVMPESWVHRQLRERALLLVDGVDELVPAQRRRVRTWLGQLCRAFPDLPIVVTSRPAAVGQTWLDDHGFGAVLLEPMNPADITEFCRRWHLAIREATAHDPSLLPCRPERLDRYEAGLLRHFDTHRHLRGLATSPLLCAMLCALNLNRNMYLPLDRMSLYDAALNLLLERRDAEREIPAAAQLRMSAKSKITILQRLAWRLTDAGRAEIAFDDCVAQVGRGIERIPDLEAGAEPVLEHLLERSGVIRQPALGRVDFVHRTFQEYLAAKEAAEDQLPELLVQRADSDQWHETILMAAGHGTPEYRSKLIGGLLKRADREPGRARALRILATACLETAHNVDPQVTARVDAALGALLPPRSTRESRSLAGAGGRVIGRLPSSLDGLSEAAAAACVRTAALINGPEALRLLAAYAPDPRFRVQLQLADVWPFFDAEEYARAVLADAPLVNGQIRVRRRDHLPHTRLLTSLNSVMADIDGVVDDLAFASDVPHLTGLGCAPARPVTDLGPLLPLASLRWLHVAGAGVSDDLRRLARLPQLEALWVDHAGDGSVVFATELPALTNLTIYFQVDPADLRPIAGLHRLTRLGLVRCSVDPTPHINGLTSLRRLALTSTAIPDDLGSIRPIIPRLEYLQIAYTKVRNLGPLARADRLEVLDISGNPIADLEPLAALSRLREIHLYGVAELDVSPLAQLPRRPRIYLSRKSNIRGLEAIRDRHRVSIHAGGLSWGWAYRVDLAWLGG